MAVSALVSAAPRGKEMYNSYGFSKTKAGLLDLVFCDLWMISCQKTFLQGSFEGNTVF